MISHAGPVPALGGRGGRDEGGQASDQTTSTTRMMGYTSLAVTGMRAEFGHRQCQCRTALVLVPRECLRFCIIRTVWALYMHERKLRI